MLGLFNTWHLLNQTYLMRSVSSHSLCISLSLSIGKQLQVCSDTWQEHNLTASCYAETLLSPFMPYLMLIGLATPTTMSPPPTATLSILAPLRYCGLQRSKHEWLALRRKQSIELWTTLLWNFDGYVLLSLSLAYTSHLPR